MRFISGPVPIAALVAMAVILAAWVTTRQKPKEPPVSQTHVYKQVDGHELRLYLLIPEHKGPQEPAPVAVFFFGGGWRKGKVSQFYGQAKRLSEKGITGALVDYRVLGRHGTLAASAVEDAIDAICWLRANSATLGLDGQRIAAVGGSSGGHLAAATATLPSAACAPGTSDSPRPNALILLNPVLALAGVAPDYEPAEDLLARVGAEPVSLSPYHQLSTQSVPTLILHGTADDKVPIFVSIKYCEKLSALNGQCYIKRYPGARHGFFNKEPYYSQTLQDSVAFLERLGWLTD